MAGRAAPTPVIYSGSGITIAQQEVKTLRSEQTTELTFNQMDTNFSKVTRVNFALNYINGGTINVKLFDYPLDPSKFDTSVPFAVLNVSGTVTEVGIFASSGLSYLDSDGTPEGKMHSINNSIILTCIPKSSLIIAKDVSATASTQPLTIEFVNLFSKLAITGLSSQTAVFDLNIGLTWIQPNLNNAVFNPSYGGLTSNSMANG